MKLDSKLFWISICVLFTQFNFAQSHCDKAIDLFYKRCEKANGLQADSTIINKAIALFETEIKNKSANESCWVHYFESLNFKSRFCITNNDYKRKILSKAEKLEEECLKKYPLSGPLLFEYITSVGLKAEIAGVLEAATSGVIDKIKTNAIKLIQVDSMHNSGAGWKVLGIMHYRTPYIALILTWPDKLYAKKILEKSLSYFPKDIANNFYYAEALLVNDEKEKAKIYFNNVMKLVCREKYLLDDVEFKVKATKYLADLK
jgi:hypothetical protein